VAPRSAGLFRRVTNKGESVLSKASDSATPTVAPWMRVISMEVFLGVGDPKVLVGCLSPLPAL